MTTYYQRTDGKPICVYCLFWCSDGCAIHKNKGTALWPTSCAYYKEHQTHGIKLGEGIETTKCA